MTLKEKIFLECKAWAEEKLNLDEWYFAHLSGRHQPEILWIGSSDSLVHVNDVTNSDPGDIILHRNIASQVRADDISMLAVLQDAVEIEHVKHIIVCGYSHCSGVRDVLLGADDRPYVKSWLSHLREIYDQNREELDALDFSDREKRLSELNIEQQIINLSKLDVIQKAWEKSDFPILYGWYFDLTQGCFREVVSMEQNKLQKVASLV